MVVSAEDRHVVPEEEHPVWAVQAEHPGPEPTLGHPVRVYMVPALPQTVPVAPDPKYPEAHVTVTVKEVVIRFVSTRVQPVELVGDKHPETRNTNRTWVKQGIRPQSETKLSTRGGNSICEGVSRRNGTTGQL